jgi:hypothetical protein
MSEHPEFDCVIAQMRALEGQFAGPQADEPISAKELLPICEAIRMLATKLAQLMPTPAVEEVAEPAGALEG